MSGQNNNNPESNKDLQLNILTKTESVEQTILLPESLNNTLVEYRDTLGEIKRDNEQIKSEIENLKKNNETSEGLEILKRDTENLALEIKQEKIKAISDLNIVKNETIKEVNIVSQKTREQSEEIAKISEKNTEEIKTVNSLVKKNEKKINKFETDITSLKETDTINELFDSVFLDAISAIGQSGGQGDISEAPNLVQMGRSGGTIKVLGTLTNSSGTAYATAGGSSTGGDIDENTTYEVACADDELSFKMVVSDTDDSERITILNTNGTNAAAIKLNAAAGGVDIDAAATKDVNIAGGQVALVSKDDAASAISLTANIGTSETIVVTNTQGTGAGAINLEASAGGLALTTGSSTGIVDVKLGSTDANSIFRIKDSANAAITQIKGDGTVLFGNNQVSLGGNLTTRNGNVTIDAVDAAKSIMLNENFIVGGGNDVTVTASGGSNRALTLGADVTLNQNLQITDSPTFATLTVTSGIIPNTADGASLGTSSKEFSDLFLADAAVISFGNDQDVTLTHVHNSGLTLKHTATGDDEPIVLTLATGETNIEASDVIGAINFQAPDEGWGDDANLVCAGIEAVSEGDFSATNNATKLSFKTASSAVASEQMSLSSSGVLTVSGGVTSITSAKVANTGNNSTGGILTIANERGGAVGGPGDEAGHIVFKTNDAGQTNQDFAKIAVTAPAVTSNSESGKIAFSVATTGSGALAEVMDITGGSNAAGSITTFNGPVSCGRGVTSITSAKVAHTGNNSTGGILTIANERGTNDGVNGDEAGHIVFKTNDDDQNNQDFAKIAVTAPAVATGSESGKLAFSVATTGSGALEEVMNITGGADAAGSTTTFAGPVTSITSAKVANTGNDATGGLLTIANERGTNDGQTGDQAGQIVFKTNDAGQTNQDFAKIAVTAPAVASDSESGKIAFQVATTTSGALAEVMNITGGADAASSTTTFAGPVAFSGGTVTQSTNKSTAVTLIKRSGQITMNNATLANNATVSFFVDNNTCSANDVIIVTHSSGGVAGDYEITAEFPSATGFRIRVKNISGGDKGDALVINFALISITTA